MRFAGTFTRAQGYASFAKRGDASSIKKACASSAKKNYVLPVKRAHASSVKGGRASYLKGDRASPLLKNLASLVLLLAAALAPTIKAAESGWPMQSMSPDLRDQASLQRGFIFYAEYCLGCHSLRFQRYQRTADDLGMSHEDALEKVVFTNQKIGELMTNAMDSESAKAWFGAAPPDLTMVTRVRSPEWVYNYLKTFYVDESRPFGMNNKVFENVGMPHALINLQGTQRDSCPEDAQECHELSLDADSGLLTPQEYDQAVYDLVNFLHYVAEPIRLERQRLGVYVLLFLAFFGVFTYLLNREFWKDVH